MNKLGYHLAVTVKKGGHGFSSRDLRGTDDPLLQRIHHFDHGRLQKTLSHQTHETEIELERQLLLAQFWDGKRWRRQAQEPELWTKPEQKTITSEPDLAASLLEIARAFGTENFSFRLLRPEDWRKETA
jgi:hypothetical protein